MFGLYGFQNRLTHQALMPPQGFTCAFEKQRVLAFAEFVLESNFVGSVLSWCVALSCFVFRFFCCVSVATETCYVVVSACSWDSFLFAQIGWQASPEIHMLQFKSC